MVVPSRHAERPFSNPFLCLVQGWRIFLRTRAQIVYKFRRNPFGCHGNVEQQNKVFGFVIIIINFHIIINAPPSNAATCPLWTSWSPLLVVAEVQPTSEVGTPMRRSYVVPMRCMVIHEYEVSGGVVT
jgi:hypothetical protein